ncbi:hypothetical protein ACUSIJ_09710 [Pseudochelatococcus sp. B33]
MRRAGFAITDEASSPAFDLTHRRPNSAYFLIVAQNIGSTPALSRHCRAGGVPSSHAPDGFFATPRRFSAMLFTPAARVGTNLD